MDRFYVLAMNPLPWKVGPVTTGRKGGKIFGRVGPDRELQGYQEGVRELLEDKAYMYTGDVEVRLWFWRNMEPYLTPQARTHRKHQADATNMQKAIEDAIQGVLIENDRNVRRITSTIVEQAHDIEPCVVIQILPWQGFDPDVLPEHVWIEVEYVRSPDAPRQESIL
jgi:hypothetical protein